jgi:hypothetical protein
MEKILKSWHLVIAIHVTNVGRLFRQSRVMRYIYIQAHIDGFWDYSSVMLMILSHVT